MSLSFETDSVKVGFGISASPVISAEWGEIGGEIEEQGDLQAALGGKLSDAPKDSIDNWHDTNEEPPEPPEPEQIEGE